MRMCLCVLVAVFALFSCEDAPTSYQYESLSPFIFHAVSRDGTSIACFRSETPTAAVDAFCIANIATGQRQSIDFAALLPPEMQLVELYPAAAWCPYDNSKLLLHAFVKIDTTGEGLGYRYAYGFLLYSSAAQTMTWMEADNLPGPQQFVQWMHGSSADADSILLSPLQRIYVPQIDTLLSPATEYMPYNYMTVPLQSPDGRYYAFPISDEMPAFVPCITHLQLNENSIRLPEPVAALNCTGWSPDSKKLLLAIRDTTYRFRLRIADIGRITSETTVLHVYTVKLPPIVSAVYSSSFLTDSTLAVAFAIKKDDPVYLWEMTPNGDILRMLLPVP